MWIIVPTQFLPSAPESEASNSESASPDLALAPSVWSRGKPTHAKFWRRVWKTGRFTRLRFGAMQQPSTLCRGVDSWIASLAEIRASQTATPAGGEGETTTGGSSTSFSGSSRACGLIVSSERTSRAMQTDSLKLSSRHWAEWVSALRLEFSQRRKLDFPTAESDSSSWPTVAARDHRSPNSAKSQETRTIHGGQQLPNYVEHLWPTPQAHDEKSGDPSRVGRFGTAAGGRNLADETPMWGTPRASDAQKGSPNQAFGDGGGVPLAASAIRWSTPNTVDAQGGDRLGEGQDQLCHQTAKWETPGVALTEGSRKTRGGTRSDELLLSGQAEQLSEQWRTPTSLSYSDSHMPGNNRNQNINTTMADSLLGPPAHLMPGGRELSRLTRFVLRQYLTLSSPKLPSWRRLRAWVARSKRRKLGESFVEWLHGWPTGWTDSENAVTGFRPWLRRSRGELLKLVSIQSIDRSLFD